MLGIPQFKEKNKENETFQKQSAMLEEVVKQPLALVWLPPYYLCFWHLLALCTLCGPLLLIQTPIHFEVLKERVPKYLYML